MNFIEYLFWCRNLASCALEAKNWFAKLGDWRCGLRNSWRLNVGRGNRESFKSLNTRWSFQQRCFRNNVFNQRAGGVAPFVQGAENPPRPIQSLKQIQCNAWNCVRACLPTFSDHLQLLPDKETMGSWRTPTRENPKSLNAFWFSFRIDVLTWLGVLGILLLKHQTSSLIQLKFWWDGFLLWLWLHFVFTDTFLKFPCEGGRSKHVQCNAWNWWELACLLQFSDHLQLLPDKETMGSWRTPTRENPKSLNAFWFSFRIDVLTWLGVLGILLLMHQTRSWIQLEHCIDGMASYFGCDCACCLHEGGRLKHMPWSAWEQIAEGKSRWVLSPDLYISRLEPDVDQALRSSLADSVLKLGMDHEIDPCLQEANPARLESFTLQLKFR